MNQGLLELAAELSRQHQPYLMATVVWARGPSSGKRGSTAIIRPDGSVTGWIGGACAEPVVIRETHEAMVDGKPRLLFLGTDEDIASVDRPDVTTVPISCTSEGALEVYLEPRLPQPHVVVIGASPAVETFASLAATLDWRVSVVDEGLALPDEIGPAEAIVVATQGHYDEPALEAALSTDAGYIGLISSPKRAETVLGYLSDRGVPAEQLARVKAPAGVDLGRIQHREIGVAILADLVARKASGELASGVEPAGKPHVAIDPVCGMEVDVSTARWIVEHEGETYYFCAVGCKASFERMPKDFVSV